MDFDEIEKYVQKIVALEFADRNHEIQIAITRVKGDMVARGITNSTITLNHFAERCKVDSPLGNPPQLGQDVVGVGCVWQFAAAKLPYGSKQVSENKNMGSSLAITHSA